MTKPPRIGVNFGEQKVLSDIAEYGWHAMNVVEDDGHPPWSFSVGLYETWTYPELIIIGRSRSTAHEMLATIANELEENRQPDLSDAGSYLLLGIACRFIPVDTQHYQDYVGFARWFYRGKHFPLYQIVWPSNDGRYPWNPKASRLFKEWQPVLGRH